MKKWLLVLSAIALSNRLCAMEGAESNDWDDVQDNQLMQEFLEIQKRNEEWDTWEPADITRTSEYVVYNNYSNVSSSDPIAIPTSTKTSNTTALPSSVASSTSYSSASSCSTNAQSSLPSIPALSKPTPLPPIPKPNPNTNLQQQHSPIGLQQTVAASLFNMASSMISDSSIETSADEDRGISRCMVPLDEDESEFDKDAGKKKLKKKKPETLPEELAFTEFVSELFNPFVIWTQQQIDNLDKS